MLPQGRHIRYKARLGLAVSPLIGQIECRFTKLLCCSMASFLLHASGVRILPRLGASYATFPTFIHLVL
jgi:hypothetical protein